ncbi:MAG: CBS domain-containing protein [Methanoregulaceae archaeon]|nr:CBS domain-containing protein [Methanoregulaceae archaeon]
MKTAADFMVEFPALRSDDRITKARKILRENIYREVFVHDAKKKLLGYIDITDVLRVTATKSDVTIEGYIKDITPVLPGDSVGQVLATIRKNRTDSVPVVDDQSILMGGVILSELFPVVTTTQRLHGSVADSMTRNVVTCSTGDTVQRIHTLIIDSGYSAFPVVKKKKLVGMISRRDLLKDGRWRASSETTTTVDNLMTTPVVSAGPDDDVRTAADIMVKHDISRLPVMENDQIIGIIDRHDILNCLT